MNNYEIFFVDGETHYHTGTVEIGSGVFIFRGEANNVLDVAQLIIPTRQIKYIKITRNENYEE